MNARLKVTRISGPLEYCGNVRLNDQEFRQLSLAEPMAATAASNSFAAHQSSGIGSRRHFLRSSDVPPDLSSG